MPKTQKVVSVQKETNKAKLIARDTEAQRVIIGMGRQRIAYDFYTRITHLPPEAGDQPAAILPTNKTPKEIREIRRSDILAAGAASRKESI
jgi:hypothetical protein